LRGLNYFTQIIVPFVISTKFWGVNLKTALGVPAAAHISSYCNKSSSINVVIGFLCPIGGIPPIAKPVCSNTKSASALPNFSPICSLIAFSLTLFVPLAIINCFTFI